MDNLKQKLRFNLNYFGLWVVYFVICRFLFLIYYANKTMDLDWLTILQIPIQGFKLDIAFAAYLSVLPFFAIPIFFFSNQKGNLKMIKAYSYIFIFFMNVLLLFDLALYGPWGIRLDSTPLMYLNTPKEMLASVPTGELIITTIVWILASTYICTLFNKRINKAGAILNKGKIWSFPILLVVTGSLIVIMRGGLQNTPINHSNVYFSENMYANHAALNFAWNFANSVSSKTYKMENAFIEMDFEKANKIEKLAITSLQQKDSISNAKVLNTKRPNVILIIWESFTAKVVEPLGGEANVTENFNRLSKEGLFFTNFYANGDRSDKGMVAILSGYYPQTQNSIIKMPNKTRTLPSLPKEMEKLGYETAFYHGGDLSFGNMKTYLRTGGINNFIDEEDFSSEDKNSKWGAHDHVLFKKFKADLSKKTDKPFFKILFTLSSHEPFEFPDTYKFGKKTDTDKFKSSHAYTDKTIGNFIAFAKKQSWWDETLIIIIADHGHQLPEHKGAFNSSKKFRIPMLWLGGALKQNKSINSNIGSQVDLPYSLLTLLNGNSSSFKWSQNIFIPSKKHYAHYLFNNGFGILSESGKYVYDYTSKKEIINTDKENPSLELLGKAITQNSYQDFLERR